MKTGCKVQCKECPFRHTSVPSYLGDYTPASAFNSLWRNIPFFCHPKINYRNPNWLTKASKNGKLCLGGLAFANQIGAPKNPLAYPEGDVEVIAARREVELRTDIEVMPVKEFMRWHEEGMMHERISEMPDRLKQYPRAI